MHADLESGTDAAHHVLYDPSIAAKVGNDEEVQAAAEAGSLLAMYTAADGPLGYRVVVGEELPDELRGKIATTTKDVLLRVPSGKLVASGLEHAGDPAKADSTLELPAGNYLVDVHELDYDWDRDIAPVLDKELGSAYRREKLGGPIAGALTLLGVGALVYGAIAWNLTFPIAGAAAAVLGFVLPRLIVGKGYEAKKADIAKRFPGLVLVMRRLADDADLSAHAGKLLSFTD